MYNVHIGGKKVQITQNNLKTFKIQRTCVYDGPGIRTTIFFKGCNLKCMWCQNPEMQSFQSELALDGDCSIDDVIEVVSRDKDYYSSTNGGVTLSGGEPLLQDPDSLIRLLQLLKKKNIKVTAETTLHAPWNSISKVAPYIDLFLVDLKVVGDDNLHMKLTQQDSTVIHSNIKKLLDLNANVKFRMVMVPGYTDGESNIKATSKFLKSIKYDSIELMRYHNLYEEKAKRLGLEVVSLNITPERSLESINKGVKLFKENGIKAENADLDSSRHKAEFSKRTLAVQKAIREAPRALCMETARLKTNYYKSVGWNRLKGYWKKPVHIHRSERFAYVLANKTVKIYPNELLVGNFNAKRVAGQLWEELYGSLPGFFLFMVNRQHPVPFECSRKDLIYFYTRIAVYWFKKGLFMRIYDTIDKIVLGLARTAEMVAGFNNNMAQICHFIPNFERVLTLGTSGIKEEIKAKQKETPANKKTFYEGALIGLDALEAWAQRYADELSRLSKIAKNPVRKKELEEMAEICAHVPKYPARTYHEALQSILFLEIALCQEQYENAISYGRLDQILYPYYKKDLEAGRITYEKAQELLCLFILKIDEVIFVNDGNSLLALNKNFETLSVDQTVTFGGVDKDGKDATNDITYMLIDVCELQTLAIDMAGRIHKNSPERYLERLAESYINGSPQPKLYSDELYIESIQRHYPVPIQDARNYAIIGCVEPNANDDHFGNTDCGNVNVALPFLQALKGHEYDLWNPGIDDQFQKLTANLVDFFFHGNNKISKYITSTYYNKLMRKRNKKKGLYIYNPPSSMEELLARFQTRLNVLTNSILRDHQIIEHKLRKHYTTPLASSLSRGCMKSGKDFYEGGATLNSSGIQALGITDVADSLYALDEVVFKNKLFTIDQVIRAIDHNFEGDYKKVQDALLAVPKFGDDSSCEPSKWVSKVMEVYNNALDSVPHCPRHGRYSAGYYALNLNTRYGRKTQALPSGRLNGLPLANSITPHYGMEEGDLLSSLNSVAKVNFTDHAENGTTATFTVDSSMFQGPEGVKKLASIYKTFLTSGGMQLQPNVVNREVLIDAYHHPEKHKYLMVRIAGYCAYFNELTKELKLSIINRTCYS